MVVEMLTVDPLKELGAWDPNVSPKFAQGYDPKTRPFVDPTARHPEVFCNLVDRE